MLKKLMQSAAALTLVLGLAAATSQQADAHRRGGGVAAGIAIGTILGLGIAGAYAGPRYYDTVLRAIPARGSAATSAAGAGTTATASAFAAAASTAAGAQQVCD